MKPTILTETESSLVVAALNYYRSTQGNLTLYQDCTALSNKFNTPDPAADGPEVSLIRAFRAFPEGSYSREYWGFVRASS